MKNAHLVTLLCTAPLLGGCFGDPFAGLAEEDSSARVNCLTPEDADRLADQTLELVNLERAEIGLTPVAPNAELSKIADEYACRMIEQDFFGHSDPTTGHGPGERAIAGKYRFLAVGENLASGPESPAEVVQLWMESESHRDVILDSRWSDFGMGIRLAADGSIFWVQEFGEPID